MYRIITVDGRDIGVTDDVIYIKIGDSGAYTFATPEDAIGVAYLSTPYNLLGHSDIEGAETVVVKKIDGGTEIYDIGNALNILLGVNE